MTMAIFVGQGTTKSPNLKIFKSQYLSEFVRYGPEISGHTELLH